MSDEQLFREVDEEVRQDQYQQLWKRYGIYVAGAAFVIVAATIAFVIWRDAQVAAREADSERFLEAVVQEAAAPEAAIPALRALAEQGTPAYRFLANLREGKLLAETGDEAQAVAAFDAAAGEDSLDGTYRDLARILAVANGMGVLSMAEVEQRIGAIDSPANPFRFSAREFLAVAALRDGQRDRAAELLRTNVEDQEAPPATRARASELLAAIGAS